MDKHAFKERFKTIALQLHPDATILETENNIAFMYLSKDHTISNEISISYNVGDTMVGVVARFCNADKEINFKPVYIRLEQRNSKYIHSHIKYYDYVNIPTDLLSLFAMYPQICYGNGTYLSTHHAVNYQNTAQFDLTQLFIAYHTFLHYESLKGGPFIKISDIITQENIILNTYFPKKPTSELSKNALVALHFIDKKLNYYISDLVHTFMRISLVNTKEVSSDDIIKILPYGLDLTDITTFKALTVLNDYGIVVCKDKSTDTVFKLSNTRIVTEPTELTSINTADKIKLLKKEVIEAIGEHCIHTITDATKMVNLRITKYSLAAMYIASRDPEYKLLDNYFSDNISYKVHLSNVSISFVDSNLIFTLFNFYGDVPSNFGKVPYLIQKQFFANEEL